MFDVRCSLSLFDTPPDVMDLSISSARATLGLSCTATPVASGVSGSFQIGSGTQTLRLDSATQAYSLTAVFAGGADILVLSILDNDTTGSTAWVAGVAQVETATAAGTITTTGNMTCTITSAGMAGSPLAVSVPVVTGDTAATWAGKVRAALAANSVLAERFTISGTSTAIILTRKPLRSFTVPGGVLPVYAANDTTLNIALADDTSAGITEAASSANTTTGTASDGVKLYGGDGKNAVGDTVAMDYVLAFQASLESIVNIITIEDDEDGLIMLKNGETVIRAKDPEGLAIGSVFTVTASEPSMLTLTVLGGNTP